MGLGSIVKCSHLPSLDGQRRCQVGVPGRYTDVGLDSQGAETMAGIATVHDYLPKQSVTITAEGVARDLVKIVKGSNTGTHIAWDRRVEHLGAGGNNPDCNTRCKRQCVGPPC